MKESAAGAFCTDIAVAHYVLATAQQFSVHKQVSAQCKNEYQAFVVWAEGYKIVLWRAPAGNAQFILSSKGNETRATSLTMGIT